MTLSTRQRKTNIIKTESHQMLVPFDVRAGKLDARSGERVFRLEALKIMMTCIDWK